MLSVQQGCDRKVLSLPPVTTSVLSPFQKEERPYSLCTLLLVFVLLAVKLMTVNYLLILAIGGWPEDRSLRGILGFAQSREVQSSEFTMLFLKQQKCRRTNKAFVCSIVSSFYLKKKPSPKILCALYQSTQDSLLLWTCIILQTDLKNCGKLYDKLK